jgi:flagellin-like protein
MKNHITLTQKHTSHRSKNLQRRAVAPVIATLLLVAIAVVGGSIIFVFSQGFFSASQVSGVPQPELVEIVGYDTRDVSPLKIHNGLDIETGGDCCGDDSDKVKTIDERITIFIQNHSSQPITIKKFSFGGVEYQYTVEDKLGNFNADPIGPQPGEYVIMNGPDGTPPALTNDLLQNPTPTILGGEIVTLVLDLDRTLSNGRDMQINLKTSNGNVFVSTLIVGQDLS